MMIKMSKEASDLITKLAEKRGKNISDLLNEAIGLEEIAIDAIEKGSTMIVRDKNGDQYPIRFREQKNVG